MAFVTASKTGKAKLEHVTALLSELKQDLTSKSLDNQKRKSNLELLKVYGRSPDNSDPIFTKDGVQTLVGQAFAENTAVDATREALSVIANALLLKEHVRTILSELDVWSSLISRLGTGAAHDEFLVSRILFYETYCPAADFATILSKHPLASVLSEKLSAHKTRFPSPNDPMSSNALTESAKLLFNIIHFAPSTLPSFNPCIPSLTALIQRCPTSGPTPLAPPTSSLVNALLPLDLSTAKASIFPESNETAFVAQLITLLDRATSTYSTVDLAVHGPSLPLLLSKLIPLAPESVLAHMRNTLLPSQADRLLPLGRSDSLSSRLLRLTTAPTAGALQDGVGTLLFNLSDSSADKFVQNIGFGYASGYLTRQGIALPTVGSGTAGGVNPVTGQRVEEEGEEEVEMTEEEKEREAERLFVLFERLRATGVVDVRNPAADAGRVEELPDD